MVGAECEIFGLRFERTARILGAAGSVGAGDNRENFVGEAGRGRDDTGLFMGGLRAETTDFALVVRNDALVLTFALGRSVDIEA